MLTCKDHVTEEESRFINTRTHALTERERGEEKVTCKSNHMMEKKQTSEGSLSPCGADAASANLSSEIQAVCCWNMVTQHDKSGKDTS